LTIQYDPEDFMANRSNYYGAILEIAENPELNRLMPLPQIHLLRSQFQPFPGANDLPDMVAEYDAMSEAIGTGKQSIAESRMRNHMRKTLGRIDQMDEDAFVRGLNIPAGAAERMRVPR
jgi:DNA-binding FadR family transcriptional regulator